MVGVWFHLSFKMGTTVTRLRVGEDDLREEKFVSSEQEGPTAGMLAMNQQEGIGCRAQGRR